MASASCRTEESASSTSGCCSPRSELPGPPDERLPDDLLDPPDPLDLLEPLDLRDLPPELPLLRRSAIFVLPLRFPRTCVV